MKIGIDLVAIRRFKKIRETEYGSWKRVFSKAEWSYSFKDSHSAEHLAGIFAAKEAAMKATGKITRDGFRYFEIRRVKGAPVINIKKSSLSISHDGPYALACIAVSLEK